MDVIYDIKLVLIYCNLESFTEICETPFFVIQVNKKFESIYKNSLINYNHTRRYVENNVYN